MIPWMAACAAICFALAVVCIVLLLTRQRERRAFRRVHQENRELAAALDKIRELTRQAEDSHSFAVRYHNPHLVRCWEERNCPHTECSARESSDLRCWQVADSLCHDSDARTLYQRMANCEHCVVYLRSQPNTVARLAEQFNDMMVMLQKEAEQASNSRRHLQQADKLAAIGELAAGVAHEINNPLDGILSCITRLERDPANLAQNMHYLHLIRDGLKRMGTVVQRLLEYAQKHDLRLQPTDICKAIEDVIALVETSARHGAVEIEVDFQEVPCLVQGDRYYLAQGLLNLALNAIAAMPNGGKLTFRASRFIPREDGEPYVQIEIEDTGIGVEPNHLDKIFEPFFTTKEPGKGTGLGLPITRSIVEEHQGGISVRSVPGDGTVMTVWLPCAEGAPAEIVQEATAG
ncbi:MAG: hypothetical protein HY706_09730 [Candidatus Hydrogenedentes bacterium]|nr:hypothetical protein [Candidatus Hydrogenedentota bacterium]